MSSGTEKRVRNQHLTIRLAPDERLAVDAAAEEAGLAPGSYVRQRLLGGEPPRPVRRGPADRRELAKLLGQLGRIGGNLNQLAKAANTGVLVYTNEIDAALAELRQTRAAIMTALGHEP